MKGFFRKRSLIKVCSIVAGIILLFSCSNEKDMREATKAELGEPDVTQSGGTGAYQYEIFIYTNKNINRAYYYNKSASCGGQSGQWYVTTVYTAEDLGYALYTSPTIVHTAVKTAEPDKSLVITATVTDDIEVENVILFYRKPGETDYQPITMSPEDTIFTAEIPSDQVTTTGIQYYLEATDNDSHKSRLPTSNYYSVIIKEAAAKTFGQTETTGTPSRGKPAGVSGIQTSPLGL
ncbi:MAG: hypothetical protein WCU00_08365 [Candidatus Latescibacterota bacterium]